MVKIQLSNTTITDCWSHMQDGWSNLSLAFNGLSSIVKKQLLNRKDVEPYEKISLRGRIKLGFAGVGLLVPVVNMLVYWALHKDTPSESVNGVRFDIARVRQFKKELAPDNIGQITSFHERL